MKRSLERKGFAGFTLIELMVVVALVAVIISLAAPAFNRFIAVQRLRGLNAALVTDLQFARSEAASRNKYVVVKFRKDGGALTCYSIAVTEDPAACNCNNTPGVNVCLTGSTEVRTVQVERSLAVTVGVPDSQGLTAIKFNPFTGGIEVATFDVFTDPDGPFLVDTTNPAVGTLRTALSVTGRPTVCSPSSQVSGVTAC